MKKVLRTPLLLFAVLLVATAGLAEEASETEDRPIQKWLESFNGTMAPIYGQVDLCVSISNKTKKGKLKKECESLRAMVQDLLDHPELYKDTPWNKPIRDMLYSLKAGATDCLKKEPFMSSFSAAQKRSQHLYGQINRAVEEEKKASEPG